MTVIRDSLRLLPRLLVIAVPMVLATVLTASPAIADEAQSIAEILSAGAPPVTDIDAALGADRLAALKQIYQARDAQPIWSAAAAEALFDRARSIAVSPKLKPLLAEALRRDQANDAQTLAERDLLLSALYGAAAKALNPDAPGDFTAALGAFAKAKEQLALLKPPPPPTPPALVPVPIPAPVASTPPAAPAPKPAAQTPSEPADVHRITVALEAYRKIAAKGGWASVPDGPTLQAGDNGPRVEALRKRLIATGDLGSGATLGPVDDELQDALRRFQTRHGLPPDGAAGAGTVAVLNVPVERRIAMLEAAHERARQDAQAPKPEEHRYLEIDVAGAAYRLVEDDKTVLTGLALLGRPASPTPALDSVINRLELNPSWKIPQSVADARLWPLQDSDATYFYNRGIHVSDDGLHQDPGPTNPLGHVKFDFDNPAGIALHGDPDSKAFEAPDRYTTLGCVALSGADDLARRLLAADPAWTADRIDVALAGRKSATVTLAQPLPLHILYGAAWVDPDGTVEFRDDAYALAGTAGTALTAPDPAGPCGS